MRRAVGVIRVSERGGREGDFPSLRDQERRIGDICEREGRRLVKVVREIDVSGGTPLDKRAGLKQAVEMVELDQADDILCAYFDRLVRSLKVQAEVLERVETANGQVWAGDSGQISNGTPGEWVNATMRGMMAEYQRRTAAERNHDAKQDALDAGVAPWPNVPPGYMREKGKHYVKSEKAPIVLQAFQLRADGATLAEVRTFLRDNGIKRSYHGVSAMLASRVYLGELHFGGFEPNLAAHEPIVPVDLFNRVQRTRVSQGRKPKSQRLLARLGVLRCGTCGSRMVVGKADRGKYDLYRCPSNVDCDRRVTISARVAEGTVSDVVKHVLADEEGRASAESHAREAEAALEGAQADLDAGFRAFSGFEDEPAAIERLRELRAARDAAQEHVDQLGSTRAAVTINAAEDWDRLTLDGRRGLIRAVVARAVVAPAGSDRRGADRITVELVGE